MSIFLSSLGRSPDKPDKDPRELRRKRAARHEPMPFVVGVNRSGTTLLRMMLDSHPELTIPPETHFIPDLIEQFDQDENTTPGEACELLTSHRRWGDFHIDIDELRSRLGGADQEPFRARHVIREFYALYAEHQGKDRWGDKTPNYIKQVYAIQKVLPEARFIHVIRDGHDVALSIADRNPGEATMTRLAERWVRRIEWVRRQRAQLDHYMEIRYEHLVVDPEPVLREVCEIAEIDYDPVMLEYHLRAPQRLRELDRDLPDDGGRPGRPASERLAGHAMTTLPPDPSRIGRWQTEMDDFACAEFEAVAGHLLIELGYEVRGGSK